MTDNLALLERLHNGEKICEEELIKNNKKLVSSIVYRFSGRGYDIDELEQIGTIGLLKAIRRFDVGFNVKFSTYAVPLILGEIKRFIRDDGLIKVSRTHKTNAMKINICIKKLEQEFNRTPTIKEISDDCNLSEESIIEALDATKTIESIYRTQENEDGNDKELLDKLTSIDEEKDVINKVMITESMDKLKKNEKEVIYMRYYEQKTQSQISKIIGVSQVQVSRIEKSALLKMRGYFKE